MHNLYILKKTRILRRWKVAQYSSYINEHTARQVAKNMLLTNPNLAYIVKPV